MTVITHHTPVTLLLTILMKPLGIRPIKRDKVALTRNFNDLEMVINT